MNIKELLRMSPKELHEYNLARESREQINDKIICEECGNDAFRVYVTVIIDDARLYCAKCGHDQMG